LRRCSLVSKRMSVHFEVIRAALSTNPFSVTRQIRVLDEVADPEWGKRSWNCKRRNPHVSAVTFGRRQRDFEDKPWSWENRPRSLTISSLIVKSWEKTRDA
jgi:hypothetical protein